MTIKSKILVPKYWTFIIIVVVSSCTTLNDHPEPPGRFIEPKTGEYFDFRENGRVRYAVVTDNYTVYFDRGSSYDGRYEILKSGQLIVQPASPHLGLFSVEISGSGDKLFLRHRMSGREATFNKVEQ